MMCSQEQETETLLQQVALSLTNITYAIDMMLADGSQPTAEQVREALTMIRNHTDATSERIYARQAPSHQIDVPLVHSPLTTTLAALASKAA